MRILTVRQPWAWAIIHGGKDVENRVRNIAGLYRGQIAIHVAQADADSAPESLWMDQANWYRVRRPQPNKFTPEWSDRGAIIGVVDLVDVHVARATASGRLVDWAEHTKPGELCSPWAEWDAHHLVLANPRPIAEPIAYKGALGLRWLDSFTIAQILGQIGEPA
jgi:hypothetical protein